VVVKAGKGAPWGCGRIRAEMKPLAGDVSQVVQGGLSAALAALPGLFGLACFLQQLRGHHHNQAAALPRGAPLGVQSSGEAGPVARWQGCVESRANQPSRLGRSKWDRLL